MVSGKKIYIDIITKKKDKILIVNRCDNKSLNISHQSPLKDINKTLIINNMFQV